MTMVVGTGTHNLKKTSCEAYEYECEYEKMDKRKKYAKGGKIWATE